jgi:hypothetical protein
LNRHRRLRLPNKPLIGTPVLPFPARMRGIFSGYGFSVENRETEGIEWNIETQDAISKAFILWYLILRFFEH